MRPLSSLGLRPPGGWTATLVIVAALGVMSIVTFLLPAIGLWLSYLPQVALSRPWTVITYPFAIRVQAGIAGPLFTLFLLLWTYQIGATIESEQGRTRYLIFWAVATVLPALLLTVTGVPLFEPSLPIGALTCAWAARRPNAQVMLFGILPLAAKWIGALATLGIFLQYWQFGGPIAALLSIISLGLAAVWAAGKIPFLPYVQKYKPSKAEAQREIDFMKEVSRRKDDRADRERLRKLLEGDDDPLR